ncbi:1,4-dihydroxy-2-naphthoate polyprenyltransferase [Candidatus Enterovibrio altilux]|uniref:1,4-dihydroxy-2-naphthoate polyprenyltransferase n=1 Tax=Candidatus Enterovibrio altilux TaxID=1927128 RepID=UPI001CC26B38|nr:1,4-dihydroxy-2-naphthoate polyprenyltransferase [Candidatus Enterovibrio luxaltus]
MFTWLDAARPKTLSLAITCILCGSTMAFETSSFSITITLLALITALLLQILANLANDYGDAVKGTDNDARVGHKRTIQQGLVTLKAMKKAIALNLILIIAFGAALISTAFDSTSEILSFIGLGILSIIAAICYTVGKKPYGYHGFGDLSVLIFFGWLGVAGTYYLQTGLLSTAILFPATACGLLAVSVLNINNLRDINNDRECGKYTLIVRMGTHWGRAYHQVLLAGSFCCFAIFALLEYASFTSWLFLLALPLAIKHGVIVWMAPNSETLTPMIAHIIKIAMLTNILFAVSVLLH